jgi:hypothetical protein
MENLPDELVRKIIRATDEDTSDIEDESGAVSQNLHRLTRQMRQPWVLRVQGDESDAASHAALWKRIADHGSEVDSLRIELRGDTLPLPTIPASVRSTVRKLQFVNVGQVSKLAGGQREEVPLPESLFDTQAWPALRKLIAPGHSLLAIRTLSHGGHGGIRTLECYMADNPNISAADRLRAHCPNLTQWRLHTSSFFGDWISLPTTLRRLWIRLDSEQPGRVGVARVYAFLYAEVHRHQVPLEEIVLSNMYFTHWSADWEGSMNIFTDPLHRIALIDCVFERRHFRQVFLGMMTSSSVSRVVERNVTIEDHEGMDDNPRPTKRPRYEALVRVLADLIRSGGLELDAARAAVFKTHWERVLSL